MFDVGNGFGISPVFYTVNRKWAFQRIANTYRLYDEEGYFVKEFHSMKSMCQYMMLNGGQ